ncbi:MAG: replication-associated recombination protein A [Bacteroidota bacterium]
MDLFHQHNSKPPLAERVRPQNLGEVIGQAHLMDPQGPFLRAIKAGRLASMIFWGPPGVGKTTLAQIIAQEADRPFRQLSAIQAGVKDVREVLRQAARFPGMILFIDEVHRFNKAQQDSLLGAVEKGLVTLIGATTENPSFEVNAALLSRCQVYMLNALTEEEVKQLLVRAIQADEWLQELAVDLKETEAIYRISGGDARKALSLLEIFLFTQDESQPITVTDEGVKSAAQEHIALYDKSGEQHYDMISAFIKSIRGGDPNGAVYWLARMLNGGEDVKFIARRLIILASEDIGNANPNALLLANACFQSVNVIGMPEARIILGQTATYLATSEKSNAAYAAINQAMKQAAGDPPRPVPLHLRNAPTQFMKNIGYGTAYKYSHDYNGEEGNQEYLPEGLEGTAFYMPKPIGSEKKIQQFLAEKWGDKYSST